MWQPGGNDELVLIVVDVYFNTDAAHGYIHTAACYASPAPSAV